jgi:hypothetical protein
MDIPFPGGWRYAVGAIGGWLLFLILLVAIVVGRGSGWPGPLIAVLAITPALIAAMQFYIAYKKVSGADEYVRSLFAKRMLAAGAFTLLVAIGWSGAELAGAPHLPAWLLYPLVWGCFGALAPIIRASTE